MCRFVKNYIDFIEQFQTLLNRDLIKVVLKSRRFVNSIDGFQLSSLKGVPLSCFSRYPQNFIQSSERALSDASKEAEKGRESDIALALKGLGTSLSPQVLFSKRAIYQDTLHTPFKSHQGNLEVVLLVQEEREPDMPYLIALSKQEAEDCLKALRRGDKIAGLCYSLFSPTIEAYFPGYGTYQKGTPPFQFPSPSKKQEPLSPFEQQVTQTKFLMGVTDAYSPKEIKYLKEFLDAQKNLKICEQIFKDYFIPGTQGIYAGSLMEGIFKEIQTTQAAKALAALKGSISTPVPQVQPKVEEVSTPKKVEAAPSPAPAPAPVVEPAEPVAQPILPAPSVKRFLQFKELTLFGKVLFVLFFPIVLPIKLGYWLFSRFKSGA